MITELCYGVAGALLISWGYNRAQRRHGLPYPPGPKPHFLWRNAFDMPHELQWVTYDKWKEEYGDILHLDALGQHLVVLNSMKTCKDLLDKRSSKYSDRPQPVMLLDLIGWDWAISFKSYCPAWRARRKLFQRFFNEQAVGQYQETQAHYIRLLLKSLLQTPEEAQEHIRLCLARIITDVTYGMEIRDHKDVFVRTVTTALRSVGAAAIPGSFLVDIIPALRYIPSWLPGAGFQKLASEWRAAVLGARDMPFTHVKEAMEKGSTKPSILHSMLTSHGDGSLKAARDSGFEEDPDQVAADAAGAAYVGGVDTTLSALQMFFIAMAKYPDVQRAAQSELGRVVGNGRLPTLEDLDSLPYIRALVRELSRWHTVGPLALPHALSEDDIYEGYFIPKGTIVCANAWSILHDPEMFPDPFTFNPSRWLVTDAQGNQTISKDLLDPDEAIWGFGRRICPGRWFAMNTVHTTILYILACFSITPRSGSPDDVVADLTLGMPSIDHPFLDQVCVKPRSPEVVRLISDF